MSETITAGGAEAGGILSRVHRGAVFIADVRFSASSSFFGQREEA